MQSGLSSVQLHGSFAEFSQAEKCVSTIVNDPTAISMCAQHLAVLELKMNEQQSFCQMKMEMFESW